MTKSLTNVQRNDILNSVLEDIGIVLDYYMITREAKRAKKIAAIKSTNEEILERAHRKIEQLMACDSTNTESFTIS